MPKNSHLSDYLFYNAENYSGKLAVSFEGRELTWKELADEVDRVASFLNPRLPGGTQRVVGLMFPNSIEYVVAYLAVVHLGHIAMPIDVIYKTLEIDAILKQIPPHLIITDSTSAARMNTNKPVVLFEDIKSAGGAYEPLRLPADDQIASLVFTSGTTGKPKVVPYTHANHLWNIITCSKVWDWNSDDSLLISLRLSHFNGLIMGLSGALYHGNSFFLQDRFKAEAVLEMLASGRISQFTHSPVVYAKLLEVEKDYDLSHVRLFISGSGPLPPATWQAFKDRFGQEILEVYGSSETGRIASNLLNERLPGSPGRILPEVEVKLSSNNEVLVKTPGVFPGYFGNPEATQAAQTTDGFWRTGDIGEMRNGRLVLKGRTFERVRKQGYSISPRDIEWALHKHPKIKDAYVMGQSQANDPSDKLVYFIVGDLDEDELIRYCRQDLPSIWRPDRVVFMESLPRNPAGKPQIQALKAML